MRLLLAAVAAAALCAASNTHGTIRVPNKAWDILPDTTRQFISAYTTDDANTMRNISESSPFQDRNETMSALEAQSPDLFLRVLNFNQHMANLTDGLNEETIQLLSMAVFTTDGVTLASILSTLVPKDNATQEYYSIFDALPQTLGYVSSAYSSLPEEEKQALMRAFPTIANYLENAQKLTEHDKAIIRDALEMDRPAVYLTMAVEMEAQASMMRINSIQERVASKIGSLKSASDFCMKASDLIIKDSYVEVIGDPELSKELENKFHTLSDDFGALPDEAKEEIRVNFPRVFSVFNKERSD